MVRKHLDIQSVLEEELKEKRAKRLGHVQRKREWQNSDFNMTSDGEAVPEADTLGPQQVESLLAFVIDEPLERALEDAERDNLVYDALGEHRILGKAKKKAQSKTSLKRGNK